MDIQPSPKLLLVEEIEAHLHPQRQLKIIKALQEESKQEESKREESKQKESKQGIQMILTTHSPNLASVVSVDCLNICYDGEFYSLAKNKTMLDPKNYSYLGRFLDVTKANLFFAQGVILVEGPTEQLLIPEFAKIMGYDLTDYGISVISINNLGFDNFVNIFKRKEQPYNKIPLAVITDADKKSIQKIEEYIDKISDEKNEIHCFVGEQLYLDTELTEGEKKKSTFEKIIFKNTIELKKLYITAYNGLKVRVKPAKDAMEFDELYEKTRDEKAPIAQEVAQLLVDLSEEEKDKVKKEIEEKLGYIVDAIKFVKPEQTNP